MKRRIICENADGMKVEFGSSFSPFLLLGCDGIYEVESTITTSANTMTDGSTYQGTVVKMRNIVLTVADKSDHRERRYELYNLFKPKTKGKFSYIEDDVERIIEYYVENIKIDSTKRVRTAVISLICPDPFFQATSDITVTMAGWNNLFEFPHEFISEGEEFGQRIKEQLKTIDNNEAADNIGLYIKIESIGNAMNPSISHVELAETIKVGTDSYPFFMENGDVLEITTGTNNKHVYFTHNGIREEVNQYLTEESEFIQLMHGKNTIGYNADSGQDNLIVSLSYRYKYLGV